MMGPAKMAKDFQLADSARITRTVALHSIRHFP
jgi:hypothetical protein